LKGGTNRYALIRLGDEGYAIPLDHILDLIENPTYESGPGKGEEAGYLNYEDRRIPIYSLGQLLGLEGPTNFLIIIRGKGSPYGLLIPERPRFQSISEEEILPLPDLLPELGKRILSGVIVVDSQLYGLINPYHLIQ